MLSAGVYTSMRRDLALLLIKHCYHDDALALLEELLENPSVRERTKALVLILLAQIYERDIYPPFVVRDAYQSAMTILLKVRRVDDVCTVYNLKRLLNFCRRKNLKEDAVYYTSVFVESYRYLVENSEGLWDIKFENWIAQLTSPRGT